MNASSETTCGICIPDLWISRQAFFGLQDCENLVTHLPNQGMIAE